MQQAKRGMTMDSSDRFWSVVVVCFAAVIISLTWAIAWNSRKTKLSAFEHVYEQVSTQGISYQVWQKAKSQ